jgi:rhodanese-related sulfurtransferase
MDLDERARGLAGEQETARAGSPGCADSGRMEREPFARGAPSASAESVSAGLAKDTPIVTYCAVGYRSGDLAERLRAAGFSNVHNLEGSIFQWANEHRPLVREEQRASMVHPYSTFWGRLLNDDVRAPLKN